jgi:hypothetical protein
MTKTNLPNGKLAQRGYMYDSNIEKHNYIVENQQFMINKIQEWLNIVNNNIKTFFGATKTRTKRDLSSDTNNY